MKRMTFRVLDVGQGSGNFVQVVDDAGDPLCSVLVDLGSTQNRDEAGVPSVKQVLTLLAKRPLIDLIVLSHSDEDHVNLVLDILEAPDIPPKSITVERTCYTGEWDWYLKRGRNVLEAIQEHTRDERPPEAFLEADHNDFTGGDEAEPFLVVEDLKIWLVMANATSALTGLRGKRPNGYKVNTNSAIVMLEFHGAQFMVTGDATGGTLFEVNKVIDTGDSYRNFQNIRMLTVPHHGSLTTLVNVAGTNTRDDKDKGKARANVKKFVESTDPDSITVSAGRRVDWKHPDNETLKFFWPAVGGVPLWDGIPEVDERHFYTAYFWQHADLAGGADEKWPVGPSGFYSVLTRYNIYTTFYVDGPAQHVRFPNAGTSHGALGVVLPPSGSPFLTLPQQVLAQPLGVAWTYTVQVKGGIEETTLVPEVNRPAYLRMVAALGGVPEGWPDPAALGDAPTVALPSRSVGDVVPVPRRVVPAPRREAPTRRRPLPRLVALP
ncbi:hypothetical protein [Actinosynnema sp. NPDC020468]|uniref:hypothetical protein n=1 Tax=Actinosynnema sp. NPDC020468 TaxID=3154488 RepID=UPI003409EE33